MLNIVAVMGRLTKDPELKRTPNGVSVCTFSIACDRSYVKQGEERQTDFLDIVAWRNTAEFVCKYFAKGQLIAANGSLQSRRYEDKDGRKVTKYEIAADNVHFADSKPGGQKGKAVENSTDDFSVIEEAEDLPF